MSSIRQSDLQAHARQKDERYVKQFAIQSPEKLQHFTGAKFVPARDESPVSHGGYSRGREITREHDARVAIPVGVGEMCGCLIGVVGQESLEIRAIIIVLARLRDCGAIENNVTLTEE